MSENKTHKVYDGMKMMEHPLPIVTESLSMLELASHTLTHIPRVNAIVILIALFIHCVIYYNFSISLFTRFLECVCVCS